MGKTLRRYLLLEVVKSFLSGLAVFTFVVVIARILDLIDLILSRGVPIGQVGRLFAYTLPGFFEITMPMAFLLAIVVAFGRLSNDGELIALRAAGISLYQMIRPVVLFAVFVSVSTFFLAAYLRPWSNQAVEQTLYEIAKVRATAALSPKVFNSDFGGMIMYVTDVDPQTGVLDGVMLADERNSYRRTISFATTGRLIADENARSVHLLLVDGTSMTFQAQQESYDVTKFRSLEVSLDYKRVLSPPHPLSAGPREMALPQLLAAKARREAEGRPALEERIELQSKFALSASAFLLVFLGVPLGMQRSRAVRAHGFSVTLGVILVYYLMTSAALTLARRGFGVPELDLWMPNLVLALAGAWMMSRAARERLQYPPVLAQLYRRIKKRTEVE